MSFDSEVEINNGEEGDTADMMHALATATDASPTRPSSARRRVRNRCPAKNRKMRINGTLVQERRPGGGRKRKKTRRKRKTRRKVIRKRRTKSRRKLGKKRHVKRKSRKK